MSNGFHGLFVLALTTGIVACDQGAAPDKGPGDKGAASSPAGQTGSGSSTVRASGSSALQPLVNAAKEKYEASHPGASIEVSAGGSKKGLADVASGAVQIGNSDLFAPDDLKSQLVDHKVAVVGFAAMANKGPFNEKVTALTMAELAKVFTGEAKNWKEIGGDDQPIVVINRAPASGTRTVFGNIVLGGDKFFEGQTEDNSGALVTKLKQTKGAISYLGLSFQDPTLTVIALKTDAGTVEPTTEAITSGKYPIWSYEHMFTKGEPTGAAKAFLDYMVSPAFQKDVLSSVKGFIAVTAMTASRDKD